MWSKRPLPGALAQQSAVGDRGGVEVEQGQLEKRPGPSSADVLERRRVELLFTGPGFQLVKHALVSRCLFFLP